MQFVMLFIMYYFSLARSVLVLYYPVMAPFTLAQRFQLKCLGYLRYVYVYCCRFFFLFFNWGFGLLGLLGPHSRVHFLFLSSTRCFPSSFHHHSFEGRCFCSRIGQPSRPTSSFFCFGRYQEWF